MTPSEPRATPPSGRSGPDPAAARRRAVPPSAARRRPEPTSMLAPSPSPLMPVDAAPRGRRSPRQELVYLSGRVPRALRDELHIRAIEEGRPVVELLRDAIRGYLDAGATPL
ncbi:hypothetical protein [Actinomycetospora chiangmaiensis]|uniref:hypothetical protein n=1 Tax=Actinomycetospora chiangmaiensis TaxID=402650 RepID=UPI00039AFC14|nr:hypothetical protein [Actinomycetospora chiangmaiensis]